MDPRIRIHKNIMDPQHCLELSNTNAPLLCVQVLCGYPQAGGCVQHRERGSGVHSGPQVPAQLPRICG
jgi:hypothetical protein